MSSQSPDFSDLPLPIGLAGPVRVNAGRACAETIVVPEIVSRGLEQEFCELAGATATSFHFSTRIFEFSPRPSDETLVRTVGTGLPLIVRRNGEVIVNFDIQATQAFHFADSGRPIYTYIPGFNIHVVPEGIRRPLSNLVQSFRAARRSDVADSYRRLPLTGFECALLLLNTILAHDAPELRRPFRWPLGKRAVFVSLHDVDTAGFLRRRERDPLFRIEANHQIRSTWFIPTAVLQENELGIEFLLKAGHEVGWHGHKHDHRDHIRPYADRAVGALASSRLADPENFPAGMRLPKLLKSNYLFERLEHSCPTLCYDTSFLQGIVPYNLWLRGRKSRLLEIPTTVPTDIRVYNELRGMARILRPEAMLRAQIVRTEQLIEAGALISIVTHPELGLSERPEFLDVYDQYLSYIRTRKDIWFAQAGELFSYWTADRFAPARVFHDHESRTTAGQEERSSSLSGSAQSA